MAVMASVFFYISDFAKWDLRKTDKEQMGKNTFIKTEEITFHSLDKIFSKFASLNLNLLTPTHLE